MKLKSPTFCAITALLFFISFKGFAQTPGIIVRPAGGGTTTLLNPDGNAWSSTRTTGFVSSDFLESEIPFKIVPVTFSEPTGDLQRGPTGKFSEIVKNVDGSGFYTWFDGANLFFRIRIGGLVSGSKAYSALIDSDNGFGNSGVTADTNYVANSNGSNGNPGFEWEVVLETNKRVAIYNVDGRSTPLFVTSYALETNSQISVARSTDSNDPDYFYDFFVPINAFIGTKAITATTSLRMIATTVMSPQAAVGGPSSDIYGIGSFTDASVAWASVMQNQPAFTPANVATGGAGISPVRTAAPVLTVPVSTGTVTVQGTWSKLDADKSNTATITLYKNGVAVGTPFPATSGVGWSFTNVALVQGDVLYATALGLGESLSPQSNNYKVIGCLAANITSTTGLTFFCASDRGFEGTMAAGTTIKLYLVTSSGTTLIGDDATTTYRIVYPTTTTWWYNGINSQSGKTACSGGAADITAGQYAITATAANKCPSPLLFTNGATTGFAVTAAPTITQVNLYEGNTTISGTATSGALVSFFKNGILVSSQTATGTAYSFDNLTLYNGDLVEVRAQTATAGISTPATRNVGLFTSPPIITTSLGGNLVAGAASISGTSPDAAGTVITMYENGVAKSTTTTVQSNGSWTYTIPVVANATYYATAQRVGGLASAASASVTAKAATLASMVPVITGTYRDDSTAIRGTLPSAFTGKVFLYIDGLKVDSSALINAATSWSIGVVSSVNYKLYAGAVLTATAQTINTATTPVTYSAENPITSNAVTVSGIIPSKPLITPVNSTIYKGQTVTYQVANAQNGMLFSLRDNADASNLGNSEFGKGSNLSLTTYPFNTIGTQTVRVKSISFTSSGTSVDTSAIVNVVNLPAKLFVNKSVASSGNGLSWATALKEVSEALNIAANYSTSTEIWVASGTYMPAYDVSGLTVPADLRERTFSIPTGTIIYGGFAGSETLLSQRNLAANTSILSGDLGAAGNTSDNSYHVVTFNGVTSPTIVDGFTVTAGNANGSGTNDRGAGIYNVKGSTNVSLANIAVNNNNASYGAGLYNNGSGAGNISSPSVSLSLFSNNASSVSGGAIYNDGSSSGSSAPSISRTFIINNSAGSGGGLYTTGNGTTTIVNAVFNANVASATGSNGGGAVNVNGGTTTIINSTLSSNTTASSTNASSNTLNVTSGATANLINTIVYGTAASHVSNTGTINYTNSDVKGVVAVNPNLSVDPLFVNSADVDGSDNLIRTTDDGLVIRCASPAAGTGTSVNAPTNDITGALRAVPPSMGAYEPALATGSEWTGKINNDWNNPGNWCGGIPTSPTNVSIPANATVIISTANALAQNVNISAGGTLLMTGSGNLIVSPGGTFTNNGTFNASASTTGKVSFTGNGTITGTTTFKNIESFGTIDFGTGSTITGEFILQPGASVVINSPTYQCPGSTLTYNTGGIYPRSLEWTSVASGKGLPSNVSVKNNTTINFPVAGAGYVCNDLTVDAGSSLLQNFSGASAPLNVGRHVNINGTLSLGNNTNDDITLGGNWTRGATGVFNNNGRTVNFTSAATSVITAPSSVTRDANGAYGGETFHSININKTGATNSVVLASNVSITNELRISRGIFDVVNSDVTIVSNANSTAHVASIPASGATINYGGTGRFIVQRHLAIGSGSTSRRWRMLTAPLQPGVDAPTINQAWQSGVSNSNRNTPVDPYPGFGTTITKSTVYNAEDGYDQGSTNNASMYYFNAGVWAVLPSTKVAITNYDGYMLFARGNRSIVVSTPNINANSTILEPKGKIKVGDIQKSITSGYQLIGNPYPSAISINNVTFSNYRSGNTTFNTNPGSIGGVGLTYYIWDPKTSGSSNVGKWVTCSSNGDGTYSVTSNASGLPTDGTIQSSAAFMINSDVAQGTLTIHETDKINTSSSVGSASRGTGSNELIASLSTTLLVGTGSAAAISEGVINSYHPAFHNEVDGQDASGISSFNTSDVLRIKSQDKLLAIERRNAIANNDTIFLYLQNVSKKAYALQFNPTNMSASVNATLEDNFKGTATPISMTDTTNYPFEVTTDVASGAADRFRIVFTQTGVLPITFSNVKAYQQNEHIAVQWTVQNEINISKYEVEKSANGRNFAAVNTTKAQGNNATVNNYNWLDLNSFEGDNYYRIKSTALNGSIEYSKIVKVSTGKSKSGFTVFPNPVRDGIIGLQLSNMPSGVYRVSITNSAGQLVNQSTINHGGGSASQTIKPSNHLSAGSYNLELSGPGKKQALKILVQSN